VASAWVSSRTPFGDELGVLVAWRVVEVAHGRLNVRVPHPLLDPRISALPITRVPKVCLRS
jgi:hypothetical protein